MAFEPPKCECFEANMCKGVLSKLLFAMDLQGKATVVPNLEEHHSRVHVSFYGSLDEHKNIGDCMTHIYLITALLGSLCNSVQKRVEENNGHCTISEPAQSIEIEPQRRKFCVTMFMS